ncbi:MAG: MFS transporter [Pseudomonadota bacterium]|nr:MAG: MFS transporter [Pseudomonadota bacterium]
MTMIPQSALAIVALFASLVLLVMGNSSLGTIAALRLEIEGYEPGAIGIVLALTSLGFVLGSLFGIRIVQRVGHIRAFAVFAGIAAVAALSHPLHVSIPGWMLFRLVLGFCIAGLMLVTESWINSHATPQSRGSLLATYMVLFFLAASSGQFIVALGDPGMYGLFVIAAIFIILSLVPISLTRSTPPQMKRGKRLAFSVLWARSELGLGGAAVSGVVLGAFGIVGPVYGYEMGLTVEEIAVFMGISILAAMVVQWPMGYLSDYLPRRLVIVCVTGAAVGMALFTAAFGQRSSMHLYGGVALFYALAACIYPLSLALTHDMLAKHQIVPASSLLLLANGLGAVAGPAIGGAAITLLGPSGLFLFLAAALGLLLLLALHSFASERAPLVREQSHCVGIAPVSTAVIIDLDPRQESG